MYEYKIKKAHYLTDWCLGLCCERGSFLLGLSAVLFLKLCRFLDFLSFSLQFSGFISIFLPFFLHLGKDVRNWLLVHFHIIFSVFTSFEWHDLKIVFCFLGWRFCHRGRLLILVLWFLFLPVAVFSISSRLMSRRLMRLVLATLMTVILRRGFVAWLL